MSNLDVKLSNFGASFAAVVNYGLFLMDTVLLQQNLNLLITYLSLFILVMTNVRRIIYEARKLYVLLWAPVSKTEIMKALDNEFEEDTKAAIRTIDGKPFERNCPECDTKFTPLSNGQVFCSDGCYEKYLASLKARHPLKKVE